MGISDFARPHRLRPGCGAGCRGEAEGGGGVRADGQQSAGAAALFHQGCVPRRSFGVDRGDSAAD